MNKEKGVIPAVSRKFMMTYGWMSARIKNILAEIREGIVWEELTELSQGAVDRPS